MMRRCTRVTPVGRNDLTRWMWMPHYGVARRLESFVLLAQNHGGNDGKIISFPEDTILLMKIKCNSSIDANLWLTLLHDSSSTYQNLTTPQPTPRTVFQLSTFERAFGLCIHRWCTLPNPCLALTKGIPAAIRQRLSAAFLSAAYPPRLMSTQCDISVQIP
jgi:hypothetical protein